MQTFEKIPVQFSWDTVDTVLLDMDGRLLDKHFDDYFWEVYLPEHYSLLHNITIERAAQELLERYRKAENSLQWSDIEHWSRELHLDISELKQRIGHLIDIHPHVFDFLDHCRNLGKQLYLVTNAHPQTLAIKLKQKDISLWFDRMICAEEIGFAKEEPQFWKNLKELLGFDPQRALFADDTEKVLHAAADFGIRHLIHIARASSRKEITYSNTYPSIDFFRELI